MSYQVLWEPEAVAQVEQFARDTPGGVQKVFAATDWLTGDPRPDGPSDDAEVLRIRVGRYRVMYEVNDDQARIHVIHLGRLR